jgi:putative transposase
MRKGQYTEEQIIGVLKEAEAGKPVKEICREHRIVDQIYYWWKAKYGRLELSEARRLRQQLVDENRRLKHRVADPTLDNQALKGLLNRK